MSCFGHMIPIHPIKRSVSVLGFVMKAFQQDLRMAKGLINRQNYSPNINGWIILWFAVVCVVLFILLILTPWIYRFWAIIVIATGMIHQSHADWFHCCKVTYIRTYTNANIVWYYVCFSISEFFFSSSPFVFVCLFVCLFACLFVFFFKLQSLEPTPFW